MMGYIISLRNNSVLITRNRYSKALVLLICFFMLSQKQVAQDQTVGVFLNTAEAVNGYTLFSPVAGTQSFLIDNCGEKIKEWNFNTVPGMMGYLLEDEQALLLCS